MGVPAAGSVVLLPFPFSDLSHSKRRPAVVLASVGQGDCVQVTSNPYGAPHAISNADGDLAEGGLHHESFARPGKLFTASESLFVATPGRLRPAKHGELIAVVGLLRFGAH
ncbi:MAG: hypothetical protein AMXMBFR64_06940 [Myxococcales bacterium]